MYLGDRKLARERLAVFERGQALTGALFAILCCGVTIVVGERALLGALRAVPSGALARSSGADDDLGASDHARAVVVLVYVVALSHRDIASVSGLISRERREIAGVRDRVTLAGGVQTRIGAVGEQLHVIHWATTICGGAG